MPNDPPSTELDSPEPIQEILLSMDPDALHALSQQLRDSHDLVYEKTAASVVIAPPSNSPPSRAVRASVVCRDIAELLETAADA